MIPKKLRSGVSCCVRRRAGLIESLEVRSLMDGMGIGAASVTGGQSVVSGPLGCGCPSCSGVLNAAVSFPLDSGADSSVGFSADSSADFSAGILPNPRGGVAGEARGGGAGAGIARELVAGLPALSSRPSAAKKIYLNFVGDFVPTWSGKTPGAVQAYDTDGNSSSFSAAEISAITEIYNRVAESYSPFNIDVTTIDPGTYPIGTVAKVQIIDNDDWYQNPNNRTAGGVALLGGFANNFGPASNYAWVFANVQGSASSIALTASHEAGHLFGLEHHGVYNSSGVLTSEYDPGDAKVGPIMGAPFDSERMLWYKAPTSSGFTDIQDDLVVIANSVNGFGFRADDFGDSVATAGGFTATTPNDLVQSGVISTNSDVDYLKFASFAGGVQFQLTRPSIGAMLNASLEIRDSAGLLLASVATASLNETISTVLPADGAYYLVVKGASGNGDVGQYTVTGKVSGQPLASLPGGSYTTTEGGSVVFNGSASTGAIAKYEWDTDYNGTTFNAVVTGEKPTFVATGADGPAARTLALRVTDFGGVSAISTTGLTILNAAPTATAAVNTLRENATDGRITVTANDASSADRAALLYSYDFNGDGTFDVVGTSSASVLIPSSFLADGPFSGTAVVQVTDKDNASATVNVPIIYSNAAPRGTLQLPVSVSEADAATIGLTNVIDGAGDLAAGLRYSFDINGDGVFDIVDSTSPTTTLAKGSLDGAPLVVGSTGSVVRVGIRVTDKDGASSTYTGSIRVVSAPPTVAISGNATAELFTQVAFGSVASDPALADTAAGLSYVWQLLQGTTSIASSRETALQFTPRTPGNYTVTLTVTDKDGDSATQSLALTVNEPPPPVLTLLTPASVREGAGTPVVFAVQLSEPAFRSIAIPYTITASGGAGLASQSVGTLMIWAGERSGNIFASVANDDVRAADPSIRLTLGAVSAVVASSLSTSAAIADDDIGVSTPDSGTLSITGTVGGDQVLIEPGTRAGYVAVRVRGRLVGEAFSPTRIVADLGDGDDTFSMDSRVRTPSMVFGGAGNDSLVGGAGRDVLIGGAGRDYLLGGGSENLLVSEGVTFGVNSAMSQSLFTQWNTTSRRVVRERSLRGVGGALAESLVVRDSSRDQVEVGSVNDSVLTSADDQTFSRRRIKVSLLA